MSLNCIDPLIHWFRLQQTLLPSLLGTTPLTLPGTQAKHCYVMSGISMSATGVLALRVLIAGSSSTQTASRSHMPITGYPVSCRRDYLHLVDRPDLIVGIRNV